MWRLVVEKWQQLVAKSAGRSSSTAGEKQGVSWVVAVMMVVKGGTGYYSGAGGRRGWPKK